MYSLLADTKSLFRRKPKIQQPRPDNIIFRLHYQFTFAFLAVAVLLVTSYAYIDTSGSAIQCMLSPGVQVSGSIINRYCWFMSTYTLPKYHQGVPGVDFIAHGVGPHDREGLDPNANSEDEEQIYHAYYQWVPLFLSFQALMFYLPHHIWKVLEGGRFRQIISGLNSGCSDPDLSSLVTYLTQRMRPEMKIEHRSWAMKMYFCEFLNFVNVVFQIFLTDTFLGGAFSSYGIEAATWSSIEAEDRVDPMYKVFPRISKCMFHKFGVSGTIERLDALCVLGMNIINEKIFVFLWFWYVFLATITAINLIIRVCEMMLPNIRFKLVRLEEVGLKNKMIDPELLASVMDQLSYSDWLLLYYLAQCMDKTAFKKLLTKLAEHLSMEEIEDEKPDSLKEMDGSLDRSSTLRSPAKLFFKQN